MKLKINNTTFIFFNDFNITLNLDAVASSFSLTVKFNPKNKSHKDLFKPLSYNEIKLFTDEDKLLLTGLIVNHTFSSGAVPKLVRISGYSLGGVLEDCNIPYDNYPLESLKRSLSDIAKKLLDLFKLNMIIDPTAVRDMNLIYNKTVARPSESIKSYLSKLASQRNILLSHNTNGDIIFFKPSFSSSPAFSFNKDNTISMRLRTKGQAFHSKIWVLRQPSKENGGLTPVDTINNSIVGAFRPGVKILSSGTDTDTSKAVKNTLAAQMKNISVSVENHNWIDLLPGDIVNVKNDEIFLFKETKFVVSRINMRQDENSKAMITSLVLPEAYTGNEPNKIFDI